MKIFCKRKRPEKNGEEKPPLPPPQTIQISSTPQVPEVPIKPENTSSPPVTLLRKILPLIVFVMVFAIVMTLLIVYRNNTARRHSQFTLNMTQDYDLIDVDQSKSDLITYIREVHLKKGVDPHHKQIQWNGKDPDLVAMYALRLLSNKTNGFFVESDAYNDGKTSRTEFLEWQFNWHGLLIQTDTRHFFNLRHHNRQRCQAINCCLSPVPHPMEVPLRSDANDDDIQIASLHPNGIFHDSDWTRIKCFPLYSLLLAVNTTAHVDFLYLETGGTELHVLETVPFESAQIEVIAVRVKSRMIDSAIRDFLTTNHYTFKKYISGVSIFMRNTHRA